MISCRSLGFRQFRITPRLLMLASVAGATPAYAQLSPSPTREQVTLPVPQQPDQGGPSLTIEGDVARNPCALDRTDYQQIRFTLTDVVFDNLRGLDAAALRPAYADFVGREIPISQLCEIRDRATAILNEAGYLAAVDISEQRIEGGAVRLNVTMAKLVGININGKPGANEKRIASYLDKLTNQPVFNRYDAERYLLLAGDLPGYNVRLALRPAGTVRGEVIGEVTVQHVSAIADFTVQNNGSKELGAWGLLARAQFFGLTGLGDRTSLAFFATPDFDEQKTVNVAHDFRIGDEGLSLGGQFTYSWAHPDLGNPALNIRSRTMFATLEASYPFIRTQESNLRGTIGFDIADQDVFFNGIPLSRDHLRVPFVRLSYDAVGLSTGKPDHIPARPLWRIGAAVEARQGIDGLGASDPCGPALANCFLPGVVPPSRLEADPSALVLRGHVDSEFRIVPKVAFAVSARGQYSDKPLLAFEEFSAGNYTTGRGYDPGALQGDSGVGVQAELRIGNATPKAIKDWAFELFGFVDQAWTWNKDILFAVPDSELTSVGVGVRIAGGNGTRIEMMAAVPLDRLPLETERRDPRFLLTFTTRLLPWSF